MSDIFRLLYKAIFKLQFKRRFLIYNWQCLQYEMAFTLEYET